MALAIGALIAWLQVTVSQATTVQSLSQSQFLQNLMRRPVVGSDKKEFPWVRGLTIYPAMDMQAAYLKDTDRKSPVSFELLMPAPGRKGWQYVSKSTLVDDPIHEFGDTPQPLTTFLGTLAQERPWVKYRYAFWREPRWAYAIWMGGSVLLIGIVWPFTLRKLVMAGYGGRVDDDEPKQPPFWKRLFAKKAKQAGDEYEGLGGGAVGAGAGKAGSQALSDEELQRIAAMEEGLRDFVGSQRQEPGGEVDDAAEPEVKKLSGGPLETANEPAKQEEPKEYDGEFYPTATHVKKKH